MAVQTDVVSLLEANIQRLLLSAGELKTTNLRLKQQVAELSEAVRVKDLKIETLASEYQNLKFARSLVPSTGDASKVKLQINRMVREIDSCIALLNS